MGKTLLTLFLPPIRVWLRAGLGWAFWLCLMLTFLWWIPGVLYAFWYVRRPEYADHSAPKTRQKRRASKSSVDAL